MVKMFTRVTDSLLDITLASGTSSQLKGPDLETRSCGRTGLKEDDSEKPPTAVEQVEPSETFQHQEERDVLLPG